MAKYLNPEDVFTPKSGKVNSDMFVKRHELEESLTKASRKQKHIIVYGESGCGKTWLYKKVFEDLDIGYFVLNAATVITSGSMSEALKMLLKKLQPVVKTGYEDKKIGEINAVLSKGALEHTNRYEISHSDPFRSLLETINKKSNGKKSALIIENVEQIVKDESAVKELSSLILYLDDEDYAKYNVKLVVVGTPNNIREYFSSISENQTIINRLQEITEVSSLKRAQVNHLAEKGFFQFLKLKLEESESFDSDILFHAIYWYTDGIPQYIHELCLEIAMNAEMANNTISESVYKKSVVNWMEESLIHEYSRVERNTNSVETRHGRRNQTIYSMAQLRHKEFTAAEVEKEVRKQFPISTSEKQLNISYILGELRNSDNPIIKKTPSKTHFRFITPKVKIISRWMLAKGGDETISIKLFNDGINVR